jgi:hypothetical protein
MDSKPAQGEVKPLPSTCTKEVRVEGVMMMMIG